MKLEELGELPAARGEVLVTGASRGIGAATEALLRTRGARTWCVQRSELNAVGGRRSLAVDLAASDAVDQILAKVEGPLAGVVLNAGVIERELLSGPEREAEDALMNQLRFNLELPLRLCRALDLAGVLLEGSSVVFVGSNLASRAIPRRVAYAASKAGMEGAVRALAQEWGPRGIRVNCVAPGLTRSAMTEDLPEEVFEGHRQEVPTRRVSLPQDVAELIAFLLSERARQICGQTWRVDGGWA